MLWLHHPFSLSSSSLFHTDPPSELYPIFHPWCGSGGRCEGFAIRGCHRTLFIWSGLLQSPFRNTEGHWWLASSYRSVVPQPICAPVPFPYGDGPVCSPIAPCWRLADFARPPGRIPPSPCPSSVSDVFALLPRFPGVPISGTMLWFVIRTACLHACLGPGLLHHASFWLPHSAVFSRLAGPWLFSIGDHSGEGLPSSPMCRPRHSHNAAKSSLHPSQRLNYLGMSLQSTSLRALPTQARIQKVLCLVTEFSSPEQPLSLWRSLLGVMSSLSTLIPGSRLRMRSLQHRLLVSCPRESPTTLVSWDDSCRRDLQWWSVQSHLTVGVDLSLPRPDLVLYTDASDTGWGASLGSDNLSGSWSRKISLYSINHRELLAIFLAIRGFLHLLLGQTVSLFTDNTSALSYLRKEGGTRSSTLNEVAQAILRLCEASGLRLLPQFVPGCLNVLADSLSRRGQVLGSEWTLHQEVCRDLFRLWPVTVDCFATSLNHRLQVYFSPMAGPQALAVDALVQSWDNLQAYAFPPFALLQRVLSKVCGSHNLELTLIAPFWPLRPWFADLLDLLVEVPVLLPFRRDLLRQPHFHHFHGNLRALALTGFRIASDPRAISASLQEWLVNLPSPGALPLA